MIFATQTEGSVIYQQLPPLAIIIISTPHRTAPHRTTMAAINQKINKKWNGDIERQ